MTADAAPREPQPGGRGAWDAGAGSSWRRPEVDLLHVLGVPAVRAPARRGESVAQPRATRPVRRPPLPQTTRLPDVPYVPPVRRTALVVRPRASAPAPVRPRVVRRGLLVALSCAGALVPLSTLLVR